MFDTGHGAAELQNVPSSLNSGQVGTGGAKLWLGVNRSPRGQIRGNPLGDERVNLLTFGRSWATLLRQGFGWAQ